MVTAGTPRVDARDIEAIGLVPVRRGDTGRWKDTISMVSQAIRWLLTFPGPQGSHGEQDVAIVERQPGTGPRGHPLYADPERTVRVEIDHAGLVNVLDLGGRPRPDTPLHAQPLH